MTFPNVSQDPYTERLVLNNVFDTINGALKTGGKFSAVLDNGSASRTAALTGTVYFGSSTSAIVSCNITAVSTSLTIVFHPIDASGHTFTSVTLATITISATGENVAKFSPGAWSQAAYTITPNTSYTGSISFQG